MKKYVSVIVIVVILVIAIVATVAYQTNVQNSKPYTVWTDLTYTGSTAGGFHNYTETTGNIAGTEFSEAITWYNYTFTVNSNTLKLIEIQNHCGIIFPGFTDGDVVKFTYTQVNATCWDFNIGYREVGPTYWRSDTYGSGVNGQANIPPLTQEQIDTITADFRAQNT